VALDENVVKKAEAHASADGMFYIGIIYNPCSLIV